MVKWRDNREKNKSTIKMQNWFRSKRIDDASLTTGAIYNQSISKLTNFIRTNIDADTFLARTGGRVLNPNAEMLFQGPVIRDFNFDFSNDCKK